MEFVISSKEDLMMKGLLKFFADDANRDKMIKILDGSSPIALRVLDWFVTNYSKQYDIIYNIEKSGKQFVVFSSYRSQLKGYKKRLFDPFCRRGKIDFEYGEGQVIQTSYGQLNFFKWAIENGVIDYVDLHLEKIVNNMNQRGSKTKHRDKNSPKKELSVNLAKTITKHNVTVTVSFQD
jgi:hypothetical protein